MHGKNNVISHFCLDERSGDDDEDDGDDDDDGDGDGDEGNQYIATIAWSINFMLVSCSQLILLKNIHDLKKLVITIVKTWVKAWR